MMLWSLVRSRSGGLIAAMSVSTLATGLVAISLPLQLHQRHTSPQETGITLSMFGFGMFLFEWVWGAVADRFGYRSPLILSQVLYAGGILLLARADSVPLMAASYLLASGMMVAVGPIGRSFLGTTLPPQLRATGLAMIAAQWMIGGAVGAGAGGILIAHFPIRSVLYSAAVLPLLSAALLVMLFRGYVETHGRDAPAVADDVRVDGPRAGWGIGRVIALTAVIMVLFELGAGGETALLPLLVTVHLNLSSATAGTALFATGMLSGLLLVPGGMASDRWGRRATMVVGGVVSAAGFLIYAAAGGIAPVIAGAGVRALGASLLWPAATAWISEASPRRRHALVMGIFGEFENFGVTIGPILGGVVWSIAGIQAAFVAYAVAALGAAVVATLAAGARDGRTDILVPEQSSDRQPHRV